MREVMKEKGVLQDYLKNHKYDPLSKFVNGYATASEPLDNYMDVSIWLLEGNSYN